jgi:hypothetical protein
MIAALFILWTLSALFVGIVIGKVITTADRREAQVKSVPVERRWAA